MTGRVAIVTGGGRGVGRGITRCFLEAGADVVICGRKPLPEPVEDGGRQAHFVQADIRKPEGVESVVNAATETFGRLDVLVNNAGGTAYADTLTVSPGFHRSTVDLNLVAPLNCSVAAYHAMKGNPEGGSIVFISSVAATIPDPVTPAYAAAKAGLSNLCRSLAMEFAPKVRVNTVIAGLILTKDSETYYGEGGKDVRDKIPMGRMGSPEDVGNACLLLSEPRYAGWITGAALECHGGFPYPLTGIDH
ncbi:SDR family oxidoreductase [Myxococcota bacterium]|nr:SDR family oxidoreductase [Myxococcota bacterium]